MGTGTGILGEKIYRNLICCSADDYDFADKRNLIFSAFMFHSIHNQDILLKKIYNCLNSEGIFILIDLVPNETIDKSNNYLEHSRIYEHGAPANYLTKEQMVDMFKSNHFTLLESKNLGIEKDFNHRIYVLKKTEA